MEHEKKEISISDLETMMDGDDVVNILPNGNVEVKEKNKDVKPKVLTFKNKLGNEYGEMALQA